MAVSCGPPSVKWVEQLPQTQKPVKKIQINRFCLLDHIGGKPKRVILGSDKTTLLSDLRRAHVTKVGSSFETPLRAGTFQCALGVKWGEADQGVIRFQGFIKNSGKETSLFTVDLSCVGEEKNQWIPVTCPINIQEDGVLVFSSYWKKKPREMETEAKTCWANPVIHFKESKTLDIVLISVDTLRADHMSCYGYSRNTSPNMDALAGNGVLFERCYTQSSWTLPAYGSLFTGLYPTEHRAGVKACALDWPRQQKEKKKQTETLALGIPTLAELLKEAGYATGGFYSNPFLHPNSGLDRGFDRYAYYQGNARAGVDLSLEWLKRNQGPAFLFLHLMDPHWPYAPPEPYDTAFSSTPLKNLRNYPPDLKRARNNKLPKVKKKLLQDLYDGEIAFTDAQIGRLVQGLKAAGRLENTLLILHSDHGEEFWEHGGFEHGHALYQEVLHVPLILNCPNRIPEGLRIKNTVRCLDLGPTILDLAGIAPFENVRGCSLAPFIHGLADHMELISYGEGILWGKPVSPWDEKKVLITNNYKFMKSSTDGLEMLFDLTNDPREQNNLILIDPDLRKKMSQELIRHYGRALGASRKSQGLKLSDKDAERLRQLGY